MTDRTKPWLSVWTVALVLTGCSASGSGDGGMLASDAGLVTDAVAPGDHSGGVAEGDGNSVPPGADGALPTDGAPATDLALDARNRGDGATPPQGTCPGLDQSVDLDGNGVADCAETLVRNPQLQSDVSVWGRAGPATLAFQPIDGRGNPASGSVKVVNPLVDMRAGFNLSGPTQCLPVNAAAQVVMNAQYFLPPGQPAGARARLRLRFFPEDGCSGTAISPDLDSGDGQSPGAWGTLAGSGTVPAAARSMRIYLYMRKDNPDPPGEVWYDNVLVRAR